MQRTACYPNQPNLSDVIFRAPNNKCGEKRDRLIREIVYPNQSMESYTNLSILEGGVSSSIARDPGELVYAGSNDYIFGQDTGDFGFIDVTSDGITYEFKNFRPPYMILRNSGSGNPGGTIGTPTVGILELTNPLTTKTGLYITKRDSNGKLIWATALDPIDSTVLSPRLIKLDSNGNIYVSGISFNSSGGGMIINNAGVAQTTGSLDPIPIVPIGFVTFTNDPYFFIAKYSSDGSILNLSIGQVISASNFAFPGIGRIVLRNNEPTFSFVWDSSTGTSITIFDSAVFPVTYGEITLIDAGTMPSTSSLGTLILKYNESLFLGWANKMVRLNFPILMNTLPELSFIILEKESK